MMLKDSVAETGAFDTLRKVSEIGYHAVEISQIPMTANNVSELDRARTDLGMDIAALSVALEVPEGVPGDSLHKDYDKIVQDAKRLDVTLLRIGMLPLGALRSVDAVVTFAMTAQSQHKDHAAAWNGVLTGAGKKAVSGVDLTVKKSVDKAFAQVKDVPGLAKLALDLENVAAATYIAAIGVVKNPAGVKTAATIQPVEMQHAAILNFLLGEYPVPDAFAKSTGARPATDKIG